MPSYGVSRDIPRNETHLVGGTLQIVSPEAVSQINSTQTAGSFLASYAVVAANATGTQASGIQLLAMNNSVSSAGAAYSVTLPASVPGTEIDVLCTTATNTVAVFPAVGDKINALSTNAGITMAALSSATFICNSTGQWYTSPRVPS